MKILFIMHDEIDAFHLLPLIEFSVGKHEIDLLFLSNKPFSSQYLKSSFHSLPCKKLIRHKSIWVGRIVFFKALRTIRCVRQQGDCLLFNQKVRFGFNGFFT